MITIPTNHWFGIPYAVLFILFLFGCSVEDAPPVKEKRVIRHSVVAMAAVGEVRAATLSAYELTDDCASARLIASQPLGRDGHFNLTLDLDAGLVLYRLTGATYIEEASRQTVSMTEGQWLAAVFHYDSALPQRELVVSPWSHLHTGLFCWALEEGRKPVEAMKEADYFIISMLGFDPLRSGMRLTTDAANNRLDVSFDNAMRLGFMNAALSQLSARFSRRLERNEHLVINSVYIAQRFYEDIRHDGVLNGIMGPKGRVFITNNEDPYPLTPAIYKTELPRSLLEFYDSNENNQISRGRGILYAMAAAMNDNPHKAVAAEGAIPLDPDPPAATWLSEDLLTGQVNISLRLSDLTAVDTDRIRFYGATAVGLVERRDGELFTARIDTRADGSGPARYHLYVSDTLGNNKTYDFPVELINDPPALRVVSSVHSREENYDLVATYEMVSARQQIAGGECVVHRQSFPLMIQAAKNEARCAVSLSPGDNLLAIRLCDTRRLCSTQSHRVVYDNQPPHISPLYEQNLYQRNISLVFAVADELTGLAGAVRWKASANGQELFGVAEPRDGNHSIFIDGARFGNNQVRFSINATDRLGNLGIYSRFYRVANIPASLSITSSPWLRGNSHQLVFMVQENSFTNVEAHCRIDEHTGFISADYKSGVSECRLILPDGLEDGVYQASIRVCGKYALCATYSSNLTKDTQGPAISLTGLSSPFTTGRIQLRVSARDDYAGLDQLSYQLNDQTETALSPDGLLLFEDLSTGAHSLVIRALDGIGNSAQETYDFLVLKDEPSLTLTSPARTDKDAYTLRARIDSASYEGDYTALCQFGSTPIPAPILNDVLSCTLDLSALQDGEHRVRISLVADYSTDYQRELALIKDTKPPVIDLTAIVSEYHSGAIPLLIGIEDSHSAIASARYVLDEREARPLTLQAEGWGFILAVDELATGRHSLTIVASDELGNEVEATKTFLVLRDEPSLIRTSPLRTRSQSYTLTAALDAGSYEGDYEGRCRLGSRRVSALIEGDLLSCSLDLTGLADGNHSIRVELTADYGHPYLRELRLVKDTDAPRISFVNLAPSYANGTFPLSLTIEDAHAGVERAFYRLNNGAEKPLTKRGGEEWGFILAIDELATGRHSISVRAADRAGNQRLLARFFLVLKDEPQVRLFSDAATGENGYSLVATIESGSYIGGYDGLCRLGSREVAARVSANSHLLRCELDLTETRDGEHRVRISLVADYGIRYQRELALVKDTQPPRLDLRAIASEYRAGAIPLLIGIEDSHSAIASASFMLDGQEARALTPRAEGWGLILAVDELATGRHSLTIVASDALGNEAEATKTFLALRDEPSLIRTSPPRTKNQSYTLTADLNAGSYEGDYLGRCRLGSRQVLALIENGALSCPLDLAGLVDGNHTVRIELTADYQISYPRQLSFIKDTTPPEIHAYNHRALYRASPVRLEFQVVDNFSPVESLFYSYGAYSRPRAARYLGNNYWTVDMELAANGEHGLTLVARDSLGQERQRDWRVLLVKDAPRLAFTHPRLSRATSMDISGNITLATPLAPVARIDCLAPNDMSVRASIRGNQFVCRGYDIEDYDENPIDVRVCDSYDNCAVFQTYVSQDARPPLVRGLVPTELPGYDATCLSDYNNISANCPIEPQSGLLALSQPSGGLLSPRPFVLYQNTTELGEGESLGLADPGAAGAAYVTVIAADASSPRFYFSRPQDLNISYSYSQLNCLTDTEIGCPPARRNTYFTNRPLIPSSYENGEARATLFLTNEFLNQAGKPLWYLASTSHIHRLDIAICDEAKNCVTRIVRFRTKLFASEPIVIGEVGANFIRLLRQSPDYGRALSAEQVAARQWEILNPSDYPVWVRLANPDDITIHYDQSLIRKENRYRKHKVREFVHSSYLPGDASCGRTPWYAGNRRRQKHRIYHQYLSENWVSAQNDPSGERGGAYGAHHYQFKTRESCSRVADRIIRHRYEIAALYPRLIIRQSDSDQDYFLVHSLRYYSVSDEGALIPVYPNNGFYQIAPRSRLIAQTNERLRTTPYYYSDRQAVYGSWKLLDDERIIEIPLTLDLSYTPSRFDEDGSAQPAPYSVRHAAQAAELTERTFRRRLPLNCANPCSLQRREDSWEEISD